MPSGFVFKLELAATLAYLADIFLKLNELNLSLQDPTITLFQPYDKFKAFHKRSICGQSMSKVKICLPTHIRMLSK